MEEFYEAMEEQIRKAGYPGRIDGEEIYEEISDLIEEKENGDYVLRSEKGDGCSMEYHVTVLEEAFDLRRILICEHDKKWIVEM